MQNISDLSCSNSYAYVPRTSDDYEKGFILASAASGAIMSTLPYFSKPFTKQLKEEQVNNHTYVNAFINSFKTSGLQDIGVKIKHEEFSKDDLVKINSGLGKTIPQLDIKAGLNACYIPKLGEIHLNINKAAIAGFHEAGHAMNHLQSKFGNVLQRMRIPGYIAAGLMGTAALFSRKKPKENDSGVLDFVKNNCGKIAFVSMLPIVAEEALASKKGIDLARNGGLGEKAIKNLKKFYGKALLTYSGHAVITGLSVFAASKIMDHYTRPKKVELDEFNL